jgi:hypothetical protein
MAGPARRPSAAATRARMVPAIPHPLAQAGGPLKASETSLESAAAEAATPASAKAPLVDKVTPKARGDPDDALSSRRPAPSIKAAPPTTRDHALSLPTGEVGFEPLTIGSLKHQGGSPQSNVSASPLAPNRNKCTKPTTRGKAMSSPGGPSVDRPEPAYSTSSTSFGASPNAFCASAAAMNSSRSPSSTAPVLEVDTPVRRSFTI